MDIQKDMEIDQLLQKEEILLSIVTVCYNDVEHLKKTMQSVAAQSVMDRYGSRTEYLVIDGNSSDGTKELLKEYESADGRKIKFRWISEPDKGIYDAMNKGIKYSHGKWIHFLNAGDVLYENGTYEHIWEHLQKETADVLYGSIVEENEYVRQRIDPLELHHIFHRMVFCHQAAFVKKEMYELYPFDTDFRIVADYDCFLRMYMDHRRFVGIDELIVTYDMNGISEQALYATHVETHKAIMKNHAVPDTFLYRVLRMYSGIRLWIIEHIPPALRWKLVAFKRKITKHKSVW